MKKRFLQLALLLSMLLLALTACGGKGGEGSAHPWKWTKKGDDISLTIENPPTEGYEWTYSDTADGMITVTRTDDGSSDDSVFTIAGEGGGTVHFVCERTDAPHDAEFTLDVALATDEKGKLSVVSADYMQNPQGGSAGESGKAQCIWYVTDENLTEIYISSGEGGGDWSVLGYDTALLRVSSPVYVDGGCTYSLEGLDAGETELLIYDLRQDYGFKFTLNTGTDLTASVAACEAGTFSVVANDIPGWNDAAAITGELSLPADVDVLRVAVGAWFGDGEDDYAEIRLRNKNTEWYLTVTNKYTADEFAAMLIDGEKDIKTTKISVGSTDALLCGDGSDYVIIWQDAAGRTFALSSAVDDMTQEELSAMAAGIAAAQIS